MSTLKSAILCLSLTAATGAGVAAAPIPTLITPGTLTIGTDPNYAPFFYLKGGETLTGFEVELMTEIARRLDLKPVWKYQPFDNLLIGLGQKRFDVVVGSHGITPERQKAADFSTPDYCSGGVIVSLPGGPKTVADLKGKTVAVQVGSTYFQKVREVPGVGEIRTLPTAPDALQNLMAKRSDAFVTDLFVAMTAQEKNPDANLQIGEMLFEERIAFAVGKGNTAMKTAVDNALAAMLRDGTYNRISQKYFKTDVRCK